MSLIVKKFGGSSVANTDRINNVCNIIEKSKKNGNQLVIVVSAMGDTTDNLLKLAHQVNENPNRREYDVLVSSGEQISMSILAMALENRGIKAISYTGWQLNIKTSSKHSIAKIKDIDVARIKEKLNDDYVVIVAGFQGVNRFNNITTLGRGGSDTSAVALAVKLSADICEIYTDVDGVYTADPRKVKTAKKLSYISYDEMLEYASLGAQVLHSRSVELAKKYNVKLCVKSSFEDVEGTYVVNKYNESLEKEILVTGITVDKNVVSLTLINVPDQPGIANKIFGALADNQINVDMIVQTSNKTNYSDITFTVDVSELKNALNVLEKKKEDMGAERLEFDTNVVKLSIVGSGIKTSPGVAAKLFSALGKNDINIEMISTSEIKISVIVKDDISNELLTKLHDEFDLNKEGE